MPEQEGSLFGPGENSVTALADDAKAFVRRQHGSKAVGRWLNLQLAELPRLGLNPELGVGDLGDEPRVAGPGLLAEVDLRGTPPLGEFPDSNEEEMSRAGAATKTKATKKIAGMVRTERASRGIGDLP